MPAILSAAIIESLWFRYPATMTGSPSQTVRRCDALKSRVDSGLTGLAGIPMCRPPKIHVIDLHLPLRIIMCLKKCACRFKG